MGPNPRLTALRHPWARGSLVGHRQSYAAFRTATGQHLATFFRGHTGTEAMGTGAFDFAGLECTFHVTTTCYLRLCSRGELQSGEFIWFLAAPSRHPT